LWFRISPYQAISYNEIKHAYLLHGRLLALQVSVAEGISPQLLVEAASCCK